MLLEASEHSVLPQPELQPDDLALLETIDGIETVVPLRIQATSVDQTVIAVGEGFAGLGLLEIVEGVPLQQGEIREGLAVCMVSERSVNRSAGRLQIGGRLAIRGVPFTIVGVYSLPPMRHEFPADVVIPDRYAHLLPIARIEFLIQLSETAERRKIEETIVGRFLSCYPDSAEVVLTQVNRQQVAFGDFYRRVGQRLAAISGASVLLASMGLAALLRFLLVQQIWVYGVRRALGAIRLDLGGRILGVACLVTLPGLAVGLAAGWFLTSRVLRCVYVAGSARPAASLLAVGLMLLTTGLTAFLTSISTTAQQPATLMRVRSA